VKGRAELGLALLLDLLGAGTALLISTRTWQTVMVDRAELVPVTVHLTGRTLDGAGTALAIAALAAVVALLATRGVARQAVGALLAGVGIAMIWRAWAAADAVGAARARSLVRQEHRGVVLGDAPPSVTVQAVWPWLAAASGVLVAAAGMLVLLRSRRWQALSVRYETPAAAAAQSGDLAMWKALDRGDDPTAT
jgi:uncharacterized membrane protein (TIGR02234 family)